MEILFLLQERKPAATDMWGHQKRTTWQQIFDAL